MAIPNPGDEFKIEISPDSIVSYVGQNERRPLKFYDVVVVPALLANHRRRGGKKLSRIAADTHDGNQLRVMSGIEPAGKDESYIWHISISVGWPNHPDRQPKRRPTDDECSQALARFRAEFEELNPPDSDGLVRHFWEKQ